MTVPRAGAAPAEPRPADALEPPSPWHGLQSRFLQAKPASEQLQIFDRSARVAQRLHRWAARYPLIRRVRVWPLALSVSAAAPFASVEALSSTARLSLWVFTLDDLFDEEHVPQAELMRRAERYQAIARGRLPGRPDDSLAVALAEVRDDLARYPLGGPLGPVWAEALCGTIAGMVAEYRWRQRFRAEGDEALPTYAEYLETGLYSIGGPPHVWAALVTLGDPSTPQHLDHLRAMERLASTCIRLANDLQSYQKEIAEGKINALVLLSRRLAGAGHAQGTAYQLAEARVREDIRRGLEELAALQAGARTRTGRPEAAIADIARFVCDFYLHHDYHTFTRPGDPRPRRASAPA